MIHCDEVFDILTRGPFPTGAPSDGIVEAHLSHCDACRQLAEALRPAIELLQEAISPEECGDLPRYGGAAADTGLPWSDSASPLKTKQAIAMRRAAPVRSSAIEPGWRWRSAAKIAAAACVGLVLAGMLRQIVVSGDALRNASPPLTVAAHWRLDRDGRQWAAEQQLAVACREQVPDFTVVAAPAGQAGGDALHIACCLGCHAAGKSHLLPPARVGSFVQACQACH